ncbi:hyaluronidase-4-like [Pleurodeles waltl]|uniref:hyaluronidase-4-like n=1 Tax=Pleurodeles waltl TaxID=8319 RepID=UPI003709A97B
MDVELKNQLLVFLLYTASVSQLSTWSVIFLVLNVSLALKPAQPPIIHRRPFIVAWNAPTDFCSTKYNIVINLSMFHLTGSPLASARGQNVTIFYFNRLGYYPSYTSEDIPVNGGLPQNASLKSHLEKANADIHYYIPSDDFRGLAVIDWEHWRPQWERNWKIKNVYREMSRKLVSEMLGNVSAKEIDRVAKTVFEQRAKAFMQETLHLGTKTRPNGLWGFYLYPDCHNYNFHEQNYSGSCPKQEMLRNNDLSWLWESSTALYPSIVLLKSHQSSGNVRPFSQFRVKESMRIASMTSHEYSLPVFIYTRLGYREEPLTFLSEQDLVNTIGESAALGASGIVIWGDMNLASSKDSCKKVKQFVTSDLGFYLTNVTKAAEVCSQHLCWNNGRCLRKTWNSLDYLHLNPESYKIHLSENLEMSVTGEASDEDLKLMVNKFDCHCYQGYGGSDCSGIRPPSEPPYSAASALVPRSLWTTACILILVSLT